MRAEIIKSITDNQVTIISGSTGCGKTTQVPAMVLDELILQNKGASVNMIVTQPRRISAIGVAERIAAERCEKVGGTVGYSIRLDNKKSNKTRLLLCTTGILLRRLQCDPDLSSVSHVFVDETHQRDLDTDFLLIIMRDLLKRRPSMKLILMSATLNASTFSSYFWNAPVIEIPGRTFPVEEYKLQDVLEITGYKIMEGSDYAKKSSSLFLSKSVVKKLYPKYSKTVHDALMIVDESVINYELIAQLVNHIATTHDEGAILIFVPGLMEITKTIDELKKYDLFTDSSRSIIYPLHSTLSTNEQTAVFNVPPKGIRKIVVSTDIAETSVTIEGRSLKYIVNIST